MGGQYNNDGPLGVIQVNVPANTTLVTGQIAEVDGFVGIVYKDVTTAADETATGALDIRPYMSHNTDQIAAADAFDTRGADLYWDSAAKALTTVAGALKKVGKLLTVKSDGRIDWFMV